MGNYWKVDIYTQDPQRMTNQMEIRMGTEQSYLE